MTNETMTTEYQCSVERDGETCWIFPYATQAQLDEHVLSGKHSFPSDMRHDVHPIFEAIRTLPTGDSTGHGAPATKTLASEAQVRFIKKLAAERPVFFATLNVDVETIGKVEASRVIDKLMAVPVEAPAQGATEAAPKFAANAYGGKCVKCGAYVEANAGQRDKQNGKWVVFHNDGECVERVAEAPKADGEFLYEAKRGDVHVVNGTYYRVHESQKSGRMYCCKARILSEAQWGVDETGARVLVQAGEVEWDKATGMIYKVSEATMATAAESAAFGEMVGRCCFCSHKIDTPESVKAGYGPDCAGKYGLPWGK